MPDPVDEKVTRWLQAEQKNNQLLREAMQKSLSEAAAVTESPQESSPIPNLGAITNFLAGLKQQADDIVGEISAVLGSEAAKMKEVGGDTLDRSASVASTLLARNWNHQGHALLRTPSANSVGNSRSSASSHGKYSSTSGRLGPKGQREVLDTMLSATKREEVNLARLNSQLASRQQILESNRLNKHGEMHSKPNGTWGHVEVRGVPKDYAKQGTTTHSASCSCADCIMNMRRNMMNREIPKREGALEGPSNAVRTRITF
jgi:hypothetical protein